MLAIKDGVRFKEYTPALGRLLWVLVRLSTRWNLMITSASDGQHAANSRHYTDEALDLRSHYLPVEKKWALKAEIEKALGPQFTVLLENLGQDQEHLHCQVRKGHTYQSEAT
jgi:hypothetical protein